MRAGELRNRITLLRPEYGEPDAFNARPVTWVEAGKVWANVEELSGSEAFKAMELQSDISTRVTIRYPGSITTGAMAPMFDGHRLDAGWRIEYRERILELAVPPIDPDGRRVELQLLCREPVTPDAVATAQAAGEVVLVGEDA